MDREYQSLVSEIKKYSYVSFDLYDTLLFRTVREPSDIFDLVEMEYNDRFIDNICLFKYKRIAAEKKARRWKEDVSLAEIYDELDYNSKVKNELQKLEIEIEIRNVIPNSIMIDLLNEVKKQNKYIIITTDMYLPEFVIREVMSKVGISFDRLFLSSEFCATKLCGNLYTIVLEQLGIQGNELIHIGDSEVSDITNAKKKGIKAVRSLVSEYEDVYKTRWLDNNNFGHVNALIQNKFKSLDNMESTYRIGYSVVGPIMVSFCQWLHSEFEKKDFDQIWFIAREGYLIKQCYEFMYPNSKGKNCYIALNNNLNRLPKLYIDYNIETLKLILGDFYVGSWDNLLKYLGIYDYKDEIERKVSEKNIDYNFEALLNKRTIVADEYNYVLSILLEYVGKVACKQYLYYANYVRSHGIEHKKIALVNNSYRGSLQINLKKICKKEGICCDIEGFQFIASDKLLSKLKGTVHSWLSKTEIAKYHIHQFYRESIIFEHLLFKPEGTARCFVENGDRIEVKLDSISDEEMNTIYIRDVQAACKVFCADYISVGNYRVNSSIIFRFINFAKYPTEEDLVKVGELIDIENFHSRFFITKDYCFSYKNILGGKRISNDLVWVHGFFAANNVSKGLVILFDIINGIRDCGLSFRNWITTNYLRAYLQTVLCKVEHIKCRLLVYIIKRLL